MDDNSEFKEWNQIFEVIGVPPKERIQFLRRDREIRIGDYGWASPMYPKKEDLIHLTGYDEKYLNIWYANFEPSELRYVGEKPKPPPIPNPFPVKP